jgi:hypothetical protein
MRHLSLKVQFFGLIEKESVFGTARFGFLRAFLLAARL